jgi:hypothetical protein
MHTPIDTRINTNLTYDFDIEFIMLIIKLQGNLFDIHQEINKYDICTFLYSSFIEIILKKTKRKKKKYTIKKNPKRNCSPEKERNLTNV